MLALLLPPNTTVDFSDPAEGFTNDGPCPLVATVYSDEVISIRHGDRWRFVVDSDGALGQPLLDALDGPDPFVLVLVTFDPLPVGPVDMRDYLRTLPSARVPLVDRRPARSGADAGPSRRRRWFGRHR